MIPQSKPKPPENSSKANLIISAVVHGVLVGVMFYFAAREGLLGKKVQKIAVEMVKEKKPEPEKPKPEPPKVEPPKIEPPKADLPKIETVKAPAAAAPPVVAPPANEVPNFAFEGGKAVNSETDPVQLFKGYLEYTLRSKWNRPENPADDQFVAEVAVTVDTQGHLGPATWLKGSGDALWDQSVKAVFKVVKEVSRRPPTNFPSSVTIRFDVQEETEPVLTP